MASDSLSPVTDYKRPIIRQPKNRAFRLMKRRPLFLFEHFFLFARFFVFFFILWRSFLSLCVFFFLCFSARGGVAQERVLLGLEGPTQSSSSFGASTGDTAAPGIAVGDRVVRGPSWNWGATQDGGPGNFGTVIDVRFARHKRLPSFGKLSCKVTNNIGGRENVPGPYVLRLVFYGQSFSYVTARCLSEWVI